MLPFEVQRAVDQARARGQKIVLVTGVFDILHQKHSDFLRDARALGDVLIVGIESDRRVKQMKGPERPYHPQNKRLKNLQDLDIATVVFILPENFDQPEQREALIAEIRPTFLAVSSHSLHQERKQALLEKYGGQLRVVTEFDPVFSTTKILADMKKNKGAS